MKSANEHTPLADDVRIEKNAQGQDIYVFDPYNPLNKSIMKEDIQQILSKIVKSLFIQ